MRRGLVAAVVSVRTDSVSGSSTSTSSAGVVERTVGLGIDPACVKLSLDVGVPVVLNLVVCPSRQPCRNQRPLVAEEAVEGDNELVFFVGEVTTLQIWPQVVDPPQATALAAAQQAGCFGKGSPAAFAVALDVGDEALVLLLAPCPFVHVLALATR